MRRRKAKSDYEVTLFPFLAVLICTMGSLIVLLVVVVQQARASAETVAEQNEDAKAALESKITEMEQAKEGFEWKSQLLEETRNLTLQELSNKRLEISHLENHIRELRTKLKELQNQIDDFELKDEKVDSAELRRQLASLQAELDLARAEYQQAKIEYDNIKPSFAIVPFEGKHGTKRRPVFIECLSDRVVLQPEGIPLFGRDFQAPITDGNPLATALRAKREYLASLSYKESNDGEPYPLLVVRPEGERSYAAARLAMKSWDAEFGYELIPTDVELKYPERDPALAEVMQDAVNESRIRRRELQAIAPQRFGRPTQVSYRASRNGGFVATGAGSRRNTDQGGNGQSPYGSPDADAFGNESGNGFGSDNESLEPVKGRFGGFSPERSTSAVSNRYASTASGGNGPDGELDGSNVGAGESGGSEFDGSGTRGRESGGGDSRTGDESHDANKQFADGQSNGAQSDSRRSGPKADGASSAGMRGAGSETASGNSAIGTPTANPVSLAGKRGENWGLPSKSSNSVGVRRPLSVAVLPDRLVLGSFANTSDRQSFQFQGSVKSQIDPFIAAIWERMKNWGIAGRGMYWKPVLNVRVARGAEDVYRELSVLLEGSGILVQRK